MIFSEKIASGDNLNDFPPQPSLEYLGGGGTVPASSKSFTEKRGSSFRKLYNFLKGKKGQSIVEFTLVLTLVALAIIVMGPYVIRSFNGHLKAWEDGVDDSIHDPFLPGNVDNIAPPACTCSAMLNRGCGLNGCAVTEMFSEVDCAPLGCAGPPQTQCADSKACCTPWVPVQPGITGCSIGCPYGERLMSRTCGGGGGNQIVCVSDPSCVFQCTGTIPDNATPCLDADKGVLVPNSVWEPIANGSCQPGMKCKAECQAGMILNPVLQTCDPPPPIPPMQCFARRDPVNGFSGQNFWHANCLPGETLTGGGVMNNGGNNNYHCPDGEGVGIGQWICYGDNDDVACYAICCSNPSPSCVVRRNPNCVQGNCNRGWIPGERSYVHCLPGEVLTGGGIRVANNGNAEYAYPVNSSNRPSLDGEVPSGWGCYSQDKDTACYAVCCQPPTPNFKCVARREPVNGYAGEHVTVKCNPGEIATGGGVVEQGGQNNNLDYPVDRFGNPSANGSNPVGWHCYGSGDSVACYAICCTPQ